MSATSETGVEYDLRAVAKRIAARSQIKDVRLVRSSFDLERPATAGRQLGFEIAEPEGRVDWEPGTNVFVTTIDYRVTLFELVPDSDDAAAQDEGGSGSTILTDVKFSIAGLFVAEMADDEDPLKDDEVTAYAATTAAFALYPFAREYVYSVTGRLGLPALTLPVMLQAWPTESALSDASKSAPAE